jgi:hypothetical protein
MMRTGLTTLWIIALIGAIPPAALAAQSPKRLSGSDVSPGVWGVLVVPDAPGPHPGVVVLPGAGGWHPWYAEVAQALADSGFVTLALDYYAETGGAAIRSDEELRAWPRGRQRSGTRCIASQRCPPSPAGPWAWSDTRAARSWRSRHHHLAGPETGVPVIRPAELRFYTIENGDPQWPGGRRLPQWTVGHATHSIDATRLL